MWLSPGVNMVTRESESVRLASDLTELHYLSSSVVMKLAEIGARSQLRPLTLAELIWQQQLSRVGTLAHLLETDTLLLLNSKQVLEGLPDAR